MNCRLLLAGALMAAALPLAAQTPTGQRPEAARPPDTGTRENSPPSARKGPPQPQQQQGFDYFIGSWDFTWMGRESPVSAGPRSGIATFSRIRSGDFMEIRIEGKTEAGTAFRDASAAAWNAAVKSIAVRERMAGVEVLSIGEWSTPLAIHLDVQPVTISNVLYKVRRTYDIRAVHSFDIIEELSVDGGPFARLGKAEFTKRAP